MSEFSGILNIINDISSLDGDLLLKADIADEEQAKFAATNFLEDDRDLHTDDDIVVTGEKAAGKIRMSDARAASSEDSVGSTLAAVVAALTEGLPKRKKRRVRGNIREELNSER
jgi:hypothetical protein